LNSGFCVTASAGNFLASVSNSGFKSAAIMLPTVAQSVVESGGATQVFGIIGNHSLSNIPHAKLQGWCNKLQPVQEAANCKGWNHVICSSLHLLHNRTPLAAEASINIQPHTVKSFGTQPSLQCCGSRGQSSWRTWELFAAAAAQEGIGPIEEQPLTVDDDDTGNGNLAQHWQKTKREYSDGELEGKMLAAVDMGTNSFHMVVVQADKQGQFRLVDTAKENVRLGTGSPDINIITQDAEERALAVMKHFKQLATTRNAEMRIVATSAVREARNKHAFVRRMREVAGVDIEVLSGQEEACLIYQGVLQALPVYDNTVLVVDIGGGSTEFVLGKAGKPLYATSLKLGHIRLSAQFLDLGRSKEELKKEQIEELRRHIQSVLADSGVIENVKKTQFEIAIGSSGTIESVEHMIHNHTAATGSADQSHTLDSSTLTVREFNAEELGVVVKKVCKAKTVEQRMKIPGLPERRADVIVAGAILLEEIFLAMGIQKMKVSPFALREGVIVDTLAQSVVNYTPGVNIRHTSVINLAKKFNTDQRMRSAQHSAQLAKEILEGLQKCSTAGTDCLSDVVLLLEEGDIELLEAATTLHFVGMFINHNSYHKHSHYLIKNSEHLLGFSPLEIEILALLARYHRKKVPSLKDEDFATLPEEIQNKVQAMCAVMRIAVALDRCVTNSIEHVHVFQRPDSVTLVSY
jgi:exopolyphosphatase/guanosine-5'-triphosphate,3'-diphosphate pyrophosphatase